MRKTSLITFLLLLAVAVFWRQQKEAPLKLVPSSIPYVRSIYSLPATFDPSQMNEGASLVFAETVYEGLVRFDESFEIQPGLADEWRTSEDGRILTFKLNKKAQFHNGSPVTAEDVVASLTRNIAPKSLVIKYYEPIKGAKDFFKGKANRVTGLQAVDSKTVKIELEKPFAPFLYILAGSTAKILPKKVLDKKDFSEPIGAGPFQVESISKEEMVLKAFEGYHRNRPKLKRMVFKITDQKQAIKLAKRGKIHDLSAWPFEGNEDIFKVGQVITAQNLETWIMGLNTRMKPFNDIAIRQAFKASFDHESFREKFYPASFPAFGYIPPGLPGHKKLLEDKVKKTQARSKEPITITIPKVLSKSAEMASYIEKTFSKQGWNVKADLMEWPQMVNLYNQKKLPVFLVSMNMDYPDAEFLLNHFESTNPDNFSGLKNREVDKMLQIARVTEDRVKRNALYKELAKKINGLALTINLFHPKSHYWLHRCVRGFKPNLTGTAYIDYREVFLDEGCLSLKRGML